MTAPKRDERQYVRVYYEQLEAEFPAVWRDPMLRGEWLVLLARADKMWPALPEIPRSVDEAALAKLVDAKIVRLLPEYRYQVRGYAKARAARQQSARSAADVRWQRVRNADADALASADAVPSPSPSPSPSTESDDSPPPPSARGRRSTGTSPRQAGSSPRDLGEHPRATGASIRQQRADEKRGGLTRLADILGATRAAAAELEASS